MGGMSLAKGIMGSNSAKKAAKRKAQQMRAMASYNARVKEMEAKSVELATRMETKKDYKAKRRAMATQQATYSKTGAIAKGTPMSVMLEQATEMELDIQNKRYNRLLEQQNLKQKAKGIRYEGEMGAQAAIAEGKAQARSSLLSGIMGGVGSFGAGMAGIDAAKFDKTYTAGSWWKY